MSEPEKFIDRWSRRKREAADLPTADLPAPAEPKENAKAPAAQAKAPGAEAPFDPASLPPIESIMAESDIRAFLRPGVPPDLSRAALRRAWSTDPAIRDFVGLVENGWDFNDPNGIPGFGPIAADDVAHLVVQAIGPSPSPEPDASQQIAEVTGEFEQVPPRGGHPEQVAQLPQVELASGQDVAAQEKKIPRSKDDVTLQNDSDEQNDVPQPRRRGHGGALPK